MCKNKRLAQFFSHLGPLKTSFILYPLEIFWHSCNYPRVELVPSNINILTGRLVAVPNEPFIDASPEAVDVFLRREVECTVLDELAPYFFYFHQTKKFSHRHPPRLR